MLMLWLTVFVPDMRGLSRLQLLSVLADSMARKLWTRIGKLPG